MAKVRGRGVAFRDASCAFAPGRKSDCGTGRGSLYRREATGSAIAIVRGVRRQVGWWFGLGLAGSVAELGLLRVMVDGLQWWLPVATAAAAETLALLKFLLADRWIFGHRVPSLQRAIKYHGAAAGALAVYWLVINGLTAALATPYVVGFVLGTGAAFTWSLATNFLWVWRARA
jgi:putative flippase GtrA